MVQERGRDRTHATPASSGSSSCVSTIPNNPAPSHANRINQTEFNVVLRDQDVVTAVWQVASAPQARTVKIEITTWDVSKVAKLLLPTVSQVDDYPGDRFLQQVSEDLRGPATRHTEETKVQSRWLQPFSKPVQQVNSVAIDKDRGIEASVTYHTLRT